MKKLLSILLAVLMVATLGVVNIAAENETTVPVSDFDDLKTAIANGTEEITVGKRIIVDETIDFNGATLIAADTFDATDGSEILLVQDSNISISNLYIDCVGRTNYGILFYNCEGGSLSDVAVKDANWHSVSLNGSTIVAKGLSTTASEERNPAFTVEYARGVNVTRVPSMSGSTEVSGYLFVDGSQFTDAEKPGLKDEIANLIYKNENLLGVYRNGNTAENYALEEIKAVAYIDKTAYSSLQSAVDAVAGKEGSTEIVLIGDESVNGTGVIVPKGSNIVINLNNLKYVINSNPLAGSTGTKNQCFQLLRDSTVVIKNGQIVADNSGIIMGIQNYSNLTLENVILDATDGNNNIGYVLSNNFGKTTITGNTQLIAKEGGCAFDVYYWPNGGYGDGVSVTVDSNFNGIINGTIEYGADNNSANTEELVRSKASLKIEGSGLIDGSISTYGVAKDNPNITISGSKFTAEPNSNYVVNGLKIHKNSDGQYEIIAKPTAISADAVSIPQNADNFNELATKSVKYVWDNGGEHSNVEGLTFTVKSGDSVVVTDNKLSAVKTGTSVITVSGEGLSKDFEVTVTVGDPKAYFDENGLTVVYPADAQKFIDSMLKGVTFDDEITDSGFYNQIYLTYQGDYKMYGGFSNGKYIYNGEVVQAVDIIKANADKTGVTISIEDLVKYGVTDGTYNVEIRNYNGATDVTKINLGTLEITTNKQIDASNDRVQTLNINIDESAFNFKVGDAVADLNKVAKITDENGNPVKNVSVYWVKDSGLKSPAGETIYSDAKYAYKFAEDGTYDVVETPNYDADTLYYLYVEYMPNAKKNYADDFKIVLNGKEIEVNKKNTFMGAGAGSVTFRLWESTDYLTIVPVGYAAAKVDYPVGVSEDVIKDKLVSIFIETNGVVNNSKQLEYVSESNTPAANSTLKEIVGDGGKLTVALRSASFEETKKDDGSSTVTMSKLVFDVAPVSSDGTVIHGKLSKAITFRLPVDPATTSKYANVYHEGEFLAQYEIKTDADGNKYIEVTNDEFSVYSYELTNTVYSTGSSSDSSSSSNSSSSSSSSSSQTSYKKPVVNTSVK